MARSISVAQQAALDAAHAMPMAFVQIDWTSGTQRWCTAGADIAWNGFTWSALGSLVDIAAVEESEDLRSIALDFTISGVTDSMRSLALSEKIRGRPVTVWFATINPATGALTDAPMAEFVGECDVLIGSEQREEGRIVSTLTLRVEDEAAVLMGAESRRYSDEDQQGEYPGDQFFRFVSDVVEMVAVFPSAQAQGGR